MGLFNSADVKTLLADANFAAIVASLGLQDVTGYGDQYFLVERSNPAVAITTSTWTIIEYNNEYFDPDGEHDTVTNKGRYTPLVAGKYVFLSQTAFHATSDGTRCKSSIDLNGGIGGWVGEEISAAGTGEQTTVHSFSIFNMNGSSDYVHGKCWHNEGSNINIGQLGTNVRTIMAGCRIGP